MKTNITSYRVPPEFVQALISHIQTYEWDVVWEKSDFDTHTTFTCSKRMMERVHAFVAGMKAGVELVEERVKKNVTDLYGETK